jgi:hypothetical protein
MVTFFSSNVSLSYTKRRSSAVAPPADVCSVIAFALTLPSKREAVTTPEIDALPTISSADPATLVPIPTLPITSIEV